MRLKRSKKILNSLLIAEDKLHNLFLAKQTGEPYHPKYQKDKKSFKKIIRARLKLERKLREYLKDLSARAVRFIDWRSYVNKIFQASTNDWISADWDNENLTMKVILTDSLLEMVELGGVSVEESLGIGIGWNSQNDLAMMFVDKYTTKLSGQLTETTLDRIRQSLKTSLAMREDQNKATERIMAVIDDPKRAATIASTETTRAYAAGRMAVGVQVGADRKQWNATLGACPICQSLDEKIAPLDKEYSPGIFMTPAHPNCHCIDDLLLPENGVPAESKDPFEVFSDFFN